MVYKYFNICLFSFYDLEYNMSSEIDVKLGYTENHLKFRIQKCHFYQLAYAGFVVECNEIKNQLAKASS